MADYRERLWVSPMPSLHKLRTKPPLVDRVSWLEGLVVSKRVIHLGFLDVERLDDKRASGTWLHERLSRHASQAIGIDLDAAGVEAAREAGYEAYACNLEDEAAVRSLRLEPGELIVAGELIEHLDCPGRFLEAVRVLLAPGGRLVLTTPNATSLTKRPGRPVAAGMVESSPCGDLLMADDRNAARASRLASARSALLLPRKACGA
jgi:SAM-dependent methyltransferase